MYHLRLSHLYFLLMNQDPSKLPSHVTQYGPYLALTILALFAYIVCNKITPELYNLLSFNGSAIADGQWWRLITGHILHTNFVHFVVNIVGLGLLWLLHGDYAGPKSFAYHFLILSVGISLCILFLSPNIQWYVGLSGVLHGYFVWGAMLDIHKKRKSGYLLLVGITIKLIDEQFFADQSFMSGLIEANVAIDAHLYGAVIGLLIGTYILFRK